MEEDRYRLCHRYRYVTEILHEGHLEERNSKSDDNNVEDRLGFFPCCPTNRIEFRFVIELERESVDCFARILLFPIFELFNNLVRNEISSNAIISFLCIYIYSPFEFNKSTNRKIFHKIVRFSKTSREERLERESNTRGKKYLEISPLPPSFIIARSSSRGKKTSDREGFLPEDL